MIIYPQRIIHRAIFIIQLIAIPIKLQRAGFILSLIEFLWRYSHINAQIKGHNTIPRIPQAIPIIVQIPAHQAPFFVPQSFFVASTGRQLSIIITATIMINRIIKNSVENGLQHIKWNITIPKYANCGQGRIGAIHQMIHTKTSSRDIIIQAIVIYFLLF